MLKSHEPCFRDFLETCQGKFREESETLKYLIRGKFFSDANPSNKYNNNRPLHIAAAYGKTLLIKMLLNNGSEVNAVSRYDHRTALHRAVYYRQLDSVQLLLEKGADITMKDVSAVTAFGIAVLKFEGIVKDNLNNAWSEEIQRPLNPIYIKKIEEFKRNLPFQKILLIHGSQMTGESRKETRYRKYSSLCKAILDDKIDVVRRIIKFLKDVDFEDVCEVQPMVYAALLERWDIVKLFKNKNADMEKVFNVAVDLNIKQILEECFVDGLKAFVIPEWGWKILHSSCVKGNFEITKLLVNQGFKIPEKFKHSLVSVLCANNRVYMLKFLLEKEIVEGQASDFSFDNVSGDDKCILFTLLCQYSITPQEYWNKQIHLCSKSRETCSFVVYVNKLKLLNYEYAKIVSRKRIKTQSYRERCECDDYGGFFDGYNYYEYDDGEYCEVCGNYKSNNSDYEFENDSDVNSEIFDGSDEEEESLNKDEKLINYKLELDKLKKNKISEGTLTIPSRTLLDFIFFNPTRAMRYSCNENLILIHQENKGDFQKTYPHYGSILNLKYQRGIRREKLMASAEELLEFALGTGIPWDLSEEIFQYFSDAQLKKFQLS